MVEYTISGLREACLDEAVKMIIATIELDPDPLLNGIGPDGGWPDPDTIQIDIGETKGECGQCSIDLDISYEEKSSTGCDAIFNSGTRMAKAKVEWSFDEDVVNADVVGSVENTEEPPEDYSDLDYRTERDYFNSDF